MQGKRYTSKEKIRILREEDIMNARAKSRVTREISSAFGF